MRCANCKNIANHLFSGQQMPVDNNPPIIEFDPTQNAILEPHGTRTSEPVPEYCVLCFFQDVIAGLKKAGRLRQIGRLVSEIGENPLYVLEEGEQRVLLIHPGVGAPLAAAFLEETIKLGAKYFIACGGCGVLQKDIAVGHAVIISNAIRDEGTSYHYLPPSREVTAHPNAVQVLESVLRKHDIPYLVGKSWTTDAIYRETHERRAKRIADGCQVVEMEAAAFFAVAKFRGVTFGQLGYGGDMVVPEGWDGRDWVKRDSVRELLFWLSVEAVLGL
jgi:uridine phosphorylase